MSRAQLYDTIGAAYTVTRRTEPRIAVRVWAALGDARTVLNVGAGTGSYEPPGRDVTAVEPSAVMRAQRPAGAAPCVAAAAESLPFEDQSFDAAMAFSTVHHWQDPIAGLREMRRVARRVVVFTHDASDTGWQRRFWLTRDYLPEVADFSVGRPSLTEQARAIGARMEPVLIPWDYADGFFEAYWRLPWAYLDEHVRRAVSVWARVGPDAEQRAVRSLREDLVSTGGPTGGCAVLPRTRKPSAAWSAWRCRAWRHPRPDTCSVASLTPLGLNVLPGAGDHGPGAGRPGVRTVRCFSVS